MTTIGNIATHNSTPASTNKIEMENPTGPASEWATIAEILSNNTSSSLGPAIAVSPTGSFSVQCTSTAVTGGPVNNLRVVGFSKVTLGGTAYWLPLFQ